MKDLHTVGINEEIENKIELPEEFREKWLEHLRSDEFGQTQNELADGNGNYCCLGVACKTAGYSDYFLREVNSATGLGKTSNGELMPFMSYISSPESSLNGNGFNLNKVPDILKGDKDFPDKLAGLNDSGCSFKEIANFIERNTIPV